MVDHTKVRDRLAVNNEPVRFITSHERRYLQTLLYDFVCLIEELLTMNHPLAINFIRRHFILDDQWTEAANGPKTYVGVIRIRPCRCIGHMKFIVAEMLGRYGP